MAHAARVRLTLAVPLCICAVMVFVTEPTVDATLAATVCVVEAHFIQPRGRMRRATFLRKQLALT